MKFRLLVPIRRSPASIAPYHYTIEPGRVVHLVHQHTATVMSVSLVENPADRIADDIFRVAASELEAA